MPGDTGGKEASRAATMDARDLAHRPELEEVKRAMRVMERQLAEAAP